MVNDLPLLNNVQELVAKSFALEAITDKPGCTSRYEDLPGKPLQDFIISGINCSRYFSLLATDLKKDSATPIFKYNLAALQASNTHKSTKYINFGLLEVMFPIVFARLKNPDISSVVATTLEVLKTTTNRDVLYILKTRKLAWSTSKTNHKIAFDTAKYENSKSVWEFYMTINRDFGPETSNFQWTEQYRTGLPILKTFLRAFEQSGEIMTTTKEVFIDQTAKNPQVALGILADMCAAAIFLWLSFYDRPV